MNKTITINISGSVFSIEEEAYQKLDNYLKEIKQRIADPNEAQEVLLDIEYRIAELFRATCPTPAATLTTKMVDEMIGVMGNPNEFGEGESKDDNTGRAADNGSKQSTGTPIVKKLYRDSNNKVIAGVCSGLGAYFNIDPVIVRVIFVLLFVSGGVSLLLYIGLWIAMPEAITVTQRMEMMGFAGPLPRNESVSGSAAPRQPSGYSRSPLENVFNAIGRGITIIAGFVFVVVSFVLLSAFFILMFYGQAFDAANINLLQLSTDYFGIEMAYWVIAAVVVLVAIPLLSLFYLGIRLLFNLPKVNKWIGVTSFILWMLALIGFFIAVAGLAGQIGNRSFERSTTTMKIGNAKTIYLEPYEGVEQKQNRKRVFSIYNKSVYTQHGHMKAEISPIVFVTHGDSCRITVERESNSPLGGKHQWVVNASDVFKQVNDSVIAINPRLRIPESSILFKQRISVTLEIPQGKSLEINNMIRDLVEFDNRE